MGVGLLAAFPSLPPSFPPCLSPSIPPTLSAWKHLNAKSSQLLRPGSLRVMASDSSGDKVKPASVSARVFTKLHRIPFLGTLLYASFPNSQFERMHVHKRGAIFKVNAQAGCRGKWRPCPAGGNRRSSAGTQKSRRDAVKGFNCLALCPFSWSRSLFFIVDSVERVVAFPLALDLT